MIRRLTRGAALAVAVGTAMIVGLAGCGVPSETDVVVEGPGQEVAPTQGDEGTSEPPGRTATTDPQEFTAQLPDGRGRRPRPGGRPGTGVHLAGGGRLEARRTGVARRPLARRPAGQRREGRRLRGAGDGDPRRRARPERRRRAGRRPSGSRTTGSASPTWAAGRPVRDRPPPNVILLSDNALTLYYEPRTLYFWSVDSTTLVPDLRYLPRRDVPTAQQPTQIIDWLARRPGGLAGGRRARSAAGRPPGGNVPAVDDNRLEVTLVQGGRHRGRRRRCDRLATQLRWSLRPATGGDPELSLRIDQVREVYTDRRLSRREPGLPGRLRPDAPVPVRQDRAPAAAGAGGRPAPRRGSPPANRALPLRVALGRDGDRTAVAVVRAGPAAGRCSTWASATTRPSGRRCRSSLVTRREIGQPAWLPGSPALRPGGGRRAGCSRSAPAAPRSARCPARRTGVTAVRGAAGRPAAGLRARAAGCSSPRWCATTAPCGWARRSSRCPPRSPS